MSEPTIRVSSPSIGEEEVSNVLDALRRGAISGVVSGDYIGEFEGLVASGANARFGIATTSGTTALALAIAVLGLGPGDEVLVPALTNIACAFAVVYAGAKPVFLDSEPVTGNVDPKRIEERITPRTRAIMPVHLYGHPADMHAVLAVAERHGLHVIEDVAEAHGALYRDRSLGGIGDIGCFSFFANKMVTTGEGGMLVTNDETFAERARHLKNLAHRSRDRFIHDDLAFNFRMTNLQAAVGVAQLRRLEDTVRMKRRLASMYIERLSGIPGLQLPVEMPWARSVFWMFTIVLPTDGPTRQEVCDALACDGIETRDFFHPLHKQPVFQTSGTVSRDERLPVAEDLGRRGLYLPSSTSLTEGEIDRVCEASARIMSGA